MMADANKSRLGTMKAKSAAMAAIEAAERAQRAAEQAANQAASTQEASEAAVRAQQQDMCSPVKGSLKGARQFFDTKPHPEAFSEGQPLDVKKYQDAVAQLSAGDAVVDFPPQAIEYEVLPNIVEALKTSQNLTHLNLRRAVPTNTMTDSIASALKGNQSLVYLNLSGNKMGDMAPEEPNLSALTKLKAFLDECETIRHVDISDNNFGAGGTELVCQGVRESISLRTLDMSGNNILTAPEGDDEAQENGANAMKDMLVKNKFLNTLVLKNNMLNNEAIETLGDALKATTRLTHLDLSGNVLGSPGAALVAGVMAENKGLKVVDLADNKIGWKGIVAIGDAIANKNRTVSTLCLQKNKFGVSKEKQAPPVPTGDEEEGEPEPEDPEELAEKRKEEAAKLEKEIKVAEKALLKLAEMLKTNPVLKDLDVAFNSIGSQQLAILTEELKTNSNLTTFNIEMNHMCGCTPGEFDGATVTNLAEALAVNTTLTNLNMRWNFVQAEGISILAPSLAKNTALRTLNVARNFLGDEGVITLAKALAENTVLTSLALGSNQITSKGAKAVAKLLKKGCPLKILDMSENALQAPGFEVLAQALINSSVQAIDLSHCSIEDSPECLTELLASASPLEKLDLSDNPIGIEMVEAATQALKSNSTLKALMLWGREDGEHEQQAQLAAELLESNPTLTSLDFGFAKVSQEVTDTINRLLRANAMRK